MATIFENQSLAENGDEALVAPENNFEIQKKILEAYRSSLFNGDIFNALYLKEELGKNPSFNSELLNTKGIEVAAISGFESCLEKGDFSSVVITREVFSEYKKIFDEKISEEAQLFLEEKDFDKLLEMQRIHLLDENIFKDSHFVELVKEKFNQCLEKKDFNKLLEMQKAKLLTVEMLENQKFKECIKKEFELSLEGDIEKAKNIEENFIEEDIFKKTKESLVRESIKEKDFSKILELKENNYFNIDLGEEEKEIVSQLVKREFSISLSIGMNIQKAQRIKKCFEENIEDIKKIVIRKIAEYFKDRDIESLSIIVGGLNIDKSFLEVPEISDFIKNEYSLAVQKGDSFRTALIKETFPELISISSD